MGALAPKITVTVGMVLVLTRTCPGWVARNRIPPYSWPHRACGRAICPRHTRLGMRSAGRNPAPGRLLISEHCAVDFDSVAPAAKPDFPARRVSAQIQLRPAMQAHRAASILQPAGFVQPMRPKLRERLRQSGIGNRTSGRRHWLSPCGYGFVIFRSVTIPSVLLGNLMP